MIRTFSVVWCVVFFVSAAGAEVTFKTPPVAARAGETVTIAFTLSAPTDVEVSILGADNTVVRHLAAGVLGGKNPPPQPLKAGLAQSLTWDLNDDFSKPAVGGPFQVRVRAGSGVKFGRFIGEDPYTFGRIHSVATDEEGKLYVSAYEGGLNQNMDTLRVFAPDGTYLRTLIPFPADLKPQRAAAMATWDQESKSFIPRNGRSQMPEFYPWGSNVHLVGASAKDGLVLLHGTDIYYMDNDGGNIRGPHPLWSKAAKLENPKWNVPQVAASVNGRQIYISNVAGTKYQPKSFDDTNANWPQGRVYRRDTDQGDNDPRKFYDLELPDWKKEPFWLPDAWNKRTAAYGISVDGKGHVYICDLVNQAIVEIDEKGTKVSTTPAPWPERVHVDPASGNYYVISRVDKPKDAWVEKKLIKIVGRGEKARVAAQWPLKQRGLGDTTALGRVGEQPVLWVGGGGALLCIQDKGDAFAEMPTAFQPKPGGQQDWNRIAVDPQREEVYTSDGGNFLFRYDGRTGKGGAMTKDGKPFHGVDLAVGYDGNLYCRTGTGYSGPLERFDRDLNPVPFASGTHSLSPYVYSRYGVGNCEKGLGVGPNGETYINFMYGWNKYFIAGFSGEGKPIAGRYLKGKIPQKSEGGQQQAKGLDSAVIGPIPESCGGLRVDLAGNIYVGLRLQPKDYLPPKEFAKDSAYATWTGSIVKFSSDGGTVLGAVKEDDEAGAEGEAAKGKLSLIGAKAIYPGIAPFSGGGFGGGGSACVCRVPRFDLDRFGRLVFTNAVAGSVAVIDNAGNVIMTFGSYGNFDSQYTPLPATAGQPLVAVPEIPLAWPTGAGFGADHIYVNDTYNRRVVQVRKQYSIELITSVK